MTSKRLYLTRHGQAEHNVANDFSLQDPILTQLGMRQSRALDRATENTVQARAELIVTSCMRRAMQTMLLAYPKIINRLTEAGKPPVILDLLQETGGNVCDIPTYPLDVLKQSQDGIFAHLDFSTLSPGYASNEGIFHPDEAAAKAKACRRWLRDRSEDHIAVVSHNGCFKWMIGVLEEVRWDFNNCEVRVFTFVSADDDEAELVEVVENQQSGVVDTK